MNTSTYITCYALLCLVSGCSDPGSGGPLKSAAPLPAPVATPPSHPRIDCETLAFPKTSDVDALPGGIWFGSLVDCEHGVEYEYVWGMVSEDGRFRILGEQGHLLRGTLGTEGDTFRGSGIDIAAAGVEYFSGPSTGLFVEGSLSERATMDGRWGTEWGFYGYFSFDYDQATYESATTLASLAGVWPYHVGNGIEGVWTVGSDGQFAGQDDSGCLQSGSFALIDDRYSVLEVEVTITGCSLAGTYNGLAYFVDLFGFGEKAIEISVDDGARAFHMLLMI